MPVLLDWGPSDYKSIGWRGGRQPGAIGAVKRMWGVTYIRQALYSLWYGLGHLVVCEARLTNLKGARLSGQLEPAAAEENLTLLPWHGTRVGKGLITYRQVCALRGLGPHSAPTEAGGVTKTPGGARASGKSPRSAGSDQR